MPSNRQIAADWGVSPAYVDRCVKRGCPTDTFENARLWRQAKTQRRKPLPQAQGVTQNLSPRGDIPEELGDDFVLGTKEAVRQSWRLLREALMEGSVLKIGAWMNLHTRAVEANVKTEHMIMDKREREKSLVPMTEAQGLIRKIGELVISRLTALPQNIAPRCNPGSPEHAMEILQSECSAIISDIQQAI